MENQNLEPERGTGTGTGFAIRFNPRLSQGLGMNGRSRVASKPSSLHGLAVALAAISKFSIYLPAIRVPCPDATFQTLP